MDFLANDGKLSVKVQIIILAKGNRKKEGRNGPILGKNPGHQIAYLLSNDGGIGGQPPVGTAHRLTLVTAYMNRTPNGHYSPESNCPNWVKISIDTESLGPESFG